MSHNTLEENGLPEQASTLPCRHAAGAATDAREVPATGAGGFVALSRFVVANGMVAEVKQAFIDRPRLVDDVPGFLKLDVISPLDAPGEIWLITYWADEASYRRWHGGHTYKGSHAGIPKGLRLDPRGTEIRTFEFICS